MAINLASPEGIPITIRSRLKAFENILRRTEYLDELLDESASLLAIAEELDEHCRACGIVGYHYTRAIPAEIKSKGLLVSFGEERRRQFLVEHGWRFTTGQIEEIKEAWESYFDRTQNLGRDGRLWFALTLNALKNGGADPLLSYFGGEMIFKALVGLRQVVNVLSSIGEPLIVSARLDAARVRAVAVIGPAWGKILLSSFHMTLNPGGRQMDWDVCTSDPIAPDDIIAIRRATELGWERKR